MRTSLGRHVIAYAAVACGQTMRALHNELARGTLFNAILMICFSLLAG
jgi:hypothetical protein